MKRRTSSPSSSTGGSPSSDFGIMASGSAEAPAAPESSDASEECPGKKKSRFQTFKNFFAKKKRKEAAGPVPESEVQLKSSQSIEDVNAAEPTSIHTDKDSDSSSTINVGSKALSQDSVFTSDPPSPETIEALQTSHDSIHNKVKSLQMQLKQAIRLGSPPAVISVKKSEDGEVVSEDDGLPCSPPEYSTIHTVLTTSSQRSSGVVQRSGSLSLEGSDSDDDQMSGASSRPVTPLASIPVDFSEPASSLSCLDCSAAHHRIAVKSRACAKRKPASRELLQTKRRDLRERILLRDTEDKLRAARTSTEEEENKDDEEISEVQEDSVISPSVLAQNEEELPASSQSQRSSTISNSAEASEDDECVPDKDHIAMSGILESSWENTVTLKLQTDDFLLDEGCEVVSEEQGSLLEEVLSSLKGPLVSGLVLESEATVEQMEVEDTAEEDVLDNPDVDDTTEHPDSTDPCSVLDDQLPFENTLSESVTLLQEVENVLQEEKVPERQEFAEDVPFEEDLQLHEGSIEREEYEVEEDQDYRKDLKEEVAEDGEKMDCAGEEVVMEQEDEDTKMEENMDKEEKHESEEDAEKEADQEEQMLVEDNKEDDDGEELNEEEIEEEENETKDQSCPLDDEEQETESNTSIKIESFHETDRSASVSTEVVTQPEDLLAQECTEQPPFMVMTSLELSFPKKTSNQPKETEYGPEILQEDANEQHELLEACEDQSTESLQIDDESSELRQEEVLSESHQSSSSESEAAKESIQEVSPSATDDPVFNKSPSRDQSSDSMRAEPSASQVETPSLPSSPLQREICQADEDTTPENPFGVRLRKTPVLHRYASEGESPPPNTEPMETQKSPFLEQLSRKPALPKKPDQVADGVVKPKRTSDVAGKASVESSESPSWISLARQKQKVFKENSLDESPESKVATQDECNKKGLMDDPSGPITKEQLKPVASPVKVSCSLEISKPVLVEKEKRTISHPVPAPLTQDEPPWLALAKKKAKAWSEMPQIVQ
ncbi:capping protein-inhibiting regulator of actin dynamics isoform X3 [Ictalurus punctatus]|uniref:Capping protein-inhibiting regulator of actin dynamics isoform X3 n=1 Tax=Ictalurus punctatus TaxID=7998 RepID=A0A9F7RDP6_ICTPU|nr:capping protein-inhibiting regulator of actin dynamics isoform X3 [Ictalurus punctatus]